MSFARLTSSRRRDRRSAFTLIELLVVVSIIALLIAILLPSLNRARDVARIAVCSSNQKQLMTAWTAYALGNHQKIVSSHPYDPDPWVKPGVSEQNMKDGLLYKYVNSIPVYHCPSDDRHYVYSSSTSAPTPSPPYLRSYSISQAIGDLTVSWSARQLSDIRFPSSTLVMLDEADPRGYNLGSWSLGSTTAWVDWPAGWHIQGDNISFADTHVEYYKFQEESTSQITWFFTPAPNSRDLFYFNQIYRPGF